MGVIYGTNSIITDNLSLYLDASHKDSNSTTWKDVIGSNNATNNGAIFVAATSTSPSYYSLDGTNDYLNVSSPNSIIQFGTNPYTIEYWFNVYDAEGTTLLDTRNSGSGIGSNWYISNRPKQINSGNGQEYYASRKHVFNVVCCPLAYINTSYRFPEDAWSGWLHAVSVREGTGGNEQKFYWNGEYNGYDTDSSDYNISADNLTIGRDGRLSIGYLKGYLSILRIYNGKALSATEVKQNYNANRGRFNL